MTGVRLLVEGSEELIGHLPNSTPSLNMGDEVIYGPAGGTLVTYTVEKVRYVAEYSLVDTEAQDDRYTVYGHTDLIVSVA